jgi:hypothetical protein
LHVKISDCLLHETPHLRLGSILDAESYSLFVVFPNLSRGSQKKTYLRTEEHRTWVDEILLPSIHEHCPFNITHHFPRSWQEAADKISARTKESAWQTKTYELNPHHTLPEQYLARIWQSVCRRTKLPKFSRYRDVFLVVDGKDLKLQFRSSLGVSDCCQQFSRYIRN